MQEELERTGESPSASAAPGPSVVEMLDAAAALALAEKIVGVALFDAGSGAADAVLEKAREAASRGERVAVVARASALAGARDAMRRIARARLAIVVHALAGSGAEELSALADLGWGLLAAAGPEDSFSFALVARRAAEDAGVPFVVTHALADASAPEGRAVAMVGLPHAKACQGFLGPSRLRPSSDPAHPSMAGASDRAFTERVPFALGSAFREYAVVSGKKLDVFDKAPLAEAPLVLVGAGPTGDAIFGAVAELRARGYDVGAVNVAALRPFPGARLVKALSRTLAVTVIEPADEPFSQGGLLARELKSAFIDALTWAPGFPGIGRVPKLFFGATGPTFDVTDLAAVCDNMLADERGRRSFSFADTEHALPRPMRVEDASAPAMVRWILDDVAVAELALGTTAATLAATLGMRAQGLVVDSGSGVTVDVTASRGEARGGMARRSPRVVLATERGAASAAAVGLLGEGTLLGVLGASEGGATLPDTARAMLRERRARVVPLAGAGSPAAVAATCAATTAAAATRGRAAIDGNAVARAVVDYLKSVGASGGEAAAELARRAFESTLDALAVERDDGRGNHGRASA